MSASELSGFYERHQFSADPHDPIDSLLQFAQSANAAAVTDLLRILNLGSEGRLIIDPFCGAGSTLLAAARLGRRASGCDVSLVSLAGTSLKLAAPVINAGDRAHHDWFIELLQATRAAAGVDSTEDVTLAPADHTWDAAEFQLAHASAQDAVTVFELHREDSLVDIFTSPPHGTGRAPLATSADSSTQWYRRLSSGPLRALRSATLRISPAPLAQLQHLVAELVGLDRLGAVAVEYEASAERPDAADVLISALHAAGVNSIRIERLYDGSPDDTPGVLHGGLVVGRSAHSDSSSSDAP